MRLAQKIEATKHIHLSDLEIAWSKIGEGMSLIPERNVEYDPVSLLFHAPVRYTSIPITYPGQSPPSSEWVQESFNQLVLGEPKAYISRGPTPPLPDEDRKDFVSDAVIHEYLEHCENECVYSGLINGLMQGGGSSTAEKIVYLLCHDLIGNKGNRKYLTPNDFASLLAKAEECKLPLQFMVPAFPFKDQNPFRTAVPPDHVDLGEVALLIRLHVLALALAQVYPFGVEWIIVSDGVVYAPIFNIDVDQALAYQAQLREYRQHLNLQNTVHIIDMDDMIDRFEGFEDVYKIILKHLENLLASGAIEDRFDILARGMKWNMNTRHLEERYDRCAIWAVLSSESTTTGTGSLADLYETVREQSREVAIKYAAFNLTMKYLGVMNRFLPLAVRATVHAKPGQVAIPRLGEVYPWNGTAVLTDATVGPSSIECKPLYKILTTPYHPVCLHGSRMPFFYDLTGGGT